MRKFSSRLLFHLVVAGEIAGTCLMAAHAAEPRAQDYAVMSLIGNELTIVTYRAATGSNVDNNIKQALPLGDDSFDRRALKEADAAIRRVVPGAETTLLLVSDKDLYARQGELYESTERAKALLDTIGAQLKDKSPRYLVLITKFRSEARLHLDTVTTGTGKLFGLGFYLDRQMKTVRGDTGETGQGFVAPYAYLAVSLVDLPTGSVIRTCPALESTSYSEARAATTPDPWGALTPEQKVRSLHDLVHRAIDSAVPQAIAPG